VLGLSITACTAHRIPQLWRAWRRPKTHAPRRFFDQARLRAAVATGLDPDDAAARTAALLKAARFRVVPAAGTGDRQVYADRWAWAGAGTVLAHLSFIMILVAFGLSAGGGTDQTLNVPVGGGPVPVPGTDWDLAADAFDASFSDTGRPLDYVSHLVLRQGEAVLAEQDVRVNQPLRHGGMKFHQSTYGSGAQVAVADQAGQTVYQGAVPLSYQSEDGSRAIGLVELPGTGMELQIAVAASGQDAAALAGLAAGQAEVALFPADQDQAVAQAVADQGVPAQVGAMTVTFQRECEFTGILVRSDPGAPLMWAGSVLLIAGMTITLAVRHRRLHVLVQARPEGGAEVLLASSDKAGVGLEAPFKNVEKRIRNGLNA
jgi:cytochrome c biogenesis protein